MLAFFRRPALTGGLRIAVDWVLTDGAADDIATILLAGKSS